ncbi:polysaccharide lyase family 7 protein [Pseudomonas resinovorans]|uniref:Polysaccharide lyase family 7 protein n=1 Tax=Metapseudomonas resinovorans TaxID=53412 RepID=A0ABT4Y8H9_METRE|nr:polysaccharide lyase family 7 protein [Pseudomonas resinovorans]MDA8484937.1 polysaccharide lyase family 7 protein [Pseudomonas resinovorans]
MIDLSTWNLTLPVGVPAVTIETPLLVGGYQDHYFQSTSTGVTFWVPVNGTTTANAVYPRSELRETYADGELRNWTYPSADNLLSANLAVSQVPSTGKLVIGQIHAFGSSSPLLKLEYQFKTTSQTANIVAKVRNSPTEETSTVISLLSGIPLNQRFSYVIDLSPKGVLSVMVNGSLWSQQLSTAWAPKPLYFKAGVYAQDNTGYETEAGKATFYSLMIEHRVP